MSERVQHQEELDRLRGQLAEITARLAAIEGRAAPSPGSPSNAGAAAAGTAVDPSAGSPPAAPLPAELPDDVIAVIGAAVAAFLGERARVRQVRLISSPTWAQQGRVAIQASHRLER